MKNKDLSGCMFFNSFAKIYVKSIDYNASVSYIDLISNQEKKCRMEIFFDWVQWHCDRGTKLIFVGNIENFSHLKKYVIYKT